MHSLHAKAESSESNGVELLSCLDIQSYGNYVSKRDIP